MATSNTDQVKALLQAKGPPTALLVLAPDEIRKHRLLEAIIKKFSLPLSHPIEAKELNNSKLQELDDGLRTLSLFARQQLFVVRNVQNVTAEHGKRLAALAGELWKQAPSSSTLVLLGTKLASNTILYKSFAKNALIDLSPLNGAELKRWIQKELKVNGIEQCSDLVLDALLRIGNEDPDQIAKLIEKAGLFVVDGALTEEHLHKLFIEQYHPREYELLDLITIGDAAKASATVHMLLRDGSNQFALLGLLQRSFNQFLLLKKEFERGKAAQEVRQKLALPPWLFNKQMGSAKRYTRQRIEAGLVAILRADGSLKNKNLGAEAVLNELLFSLTP